MRTTFFYSVGMGTVLAMSVLLACQKDDTQDMQEDNPDELVVESTEASRMDNTSEGAFGLMDLAFNEVESRSGGDGSFFPECASISITHENGVTLVTLLFQPECELPNGSIVSGKILFSYGPVQNGTRYIAYHFENFTYNNYGIDGEGTVFKELHNDRGNPQSTIHSALHITAPSGATATYNGTKVREWVEGFSTGHWDDNVYMITGHRKITFSNGFESKAMVMQALRREVTCPYFVSGNVKISRNDNFGTLDYGDGTCDNLAVLTVNGVPHEIVLN